LPFGLNAAVERAEAVKPRLWEEHATLSTREVVRLLRIAPA
jgi:hypothetical protein